jgi:hypothetical protein
MTRVLGNIASQRHDLTREFVTRHHGIACYRIVASKDMQVSAANATRSYPNDYFIWTGRRIWHIPHSDIARSINDYSAHNTSLFTRCY